MLGNADENSRPHLGLDVCRQKQISRSTPERRSDSFQYADRDVVFAPFDVTDVVL